MTLRSALFATLSFFLILGCEDSAKKNDPVGGVDPNDPIVQVALVPIPASTTIFVGSEVSFTWYATTQSGNRITDLPAELTFSPQVVPSDAATRTYRFTEPNQYTATVRLNPPYEQFSDELILTVTDQAPVVNIEYPSRGETVIASANGITLRGRTEYASRLTVNGQEVSLATDGTFAHPFQPAWGLNQLNIEAENAGVSTNITPTFSYADAYESTLTDRGKGVELTDALMMAIAAAFFDDGIHDRRNIDDLATVVEVIIEDSDLATALGTTDAIESLRTRQDIGEFLGAQTTLDVRTSIVPPTAVGPTQVILDPVNGGIAFEARIGNDSKPALTIRLKVDLTFEFVSSDGRTGQATGSIYPTIRVGSALLSGIFFINKEPGMMPTASLSDFTLDINNVESDPIEDVELTLDFLGTTSTIDLSGIISLDSFTMNYIDPVVNRAIDFITDSLESIVETASQTLLLDLFESLTVEDTLTFDNVFDPTRGSISLSYKTELNRFNFIDSGALVGLNLDVYTPPAIPRDNLGAIRRNGCLQGRPNQFTPNWQNDVAFALQGDAINGLLYGIWQSGLITGPINLTEVLGENSFLTGDDFNIVLDPYAPPILSACRDEQGATIRIGDLRMELAGELINIQLDSTVFVDVDVRAIYRADSDGIFVEVGEVQNFDVEIVEVGEAADEERLRPFLEEQLGIIINGLLVGQGVGPLPLPSIDFTELIENLNAEDTLDIVPTGINSRDGHILVEANLD